MTKIIKDQKEFFNQNADTSKVSVQHKLFDIYVNKEQYDGLSFISSCKNILDYGCGTGTSIKRLLEGRNPSDFFIVGVDIAENAVKKAQENFPDYTFYHISENTIPEVEDESFDGCYMLHVLHHATDHKDIFDVISKKLKPGGKFLINDLTSKNPIISFGRKLFPKISGVVESKFEDDLVVDGNIPDKYELDSALIKKQLKEAGFRIQKETYGHLFFFVFGWIDRFLPLTKVKFIRNLYKRLIQFEKFLLKKPFFQKRAEVICFECVKK